MKKKKVKLPAKRNDDCKSAVSTRDNGCSHRVQAGSARNSPYSKHETDANEQLILNGLAKAEDWREQKRRLQKEKIMKESKSKAYYHQLRMMSLIRYGGNPPSCACCGEKEIMFLQIDHIKGGGTKHRKEIGTGTQLQSWLKKNNYPKGFRVLCANCNSAYGHYGYCPHQKNKKQKEKA